MAFDENLIFSNFYRFLEDKKRAPFGALKQKR